jgi:hypothetical protein
MLSLFFLSGNHAKRSGLQQGELLLVDIVLVAPSAFCDEPHGRNLSAWNRPNRTYPDSPSKLVRIPATVVF